MNILEKDEYKNKHNKMYRDATMKLASSASEQNLCFTYVCMNDIKPNSFVKAPSSEYLTGEVEEIEHEEEPIQVGRSKALYELVESSKKENDVSDKELNGAESSTPCPLTISGMCENEDNPQSNNNANILKLTKMKWLTENQDESSDSSSPSVSRTDSSSSTNCSRESEEGGLKECISIKDKHLSTILRLDKEHNMFGLSNIAIVGSRPSKKMHKDEGKAVFYQTAIVQICCGNKCCKNMSKTDLPSSLKCGECASCCVDRCCILRPPHCSSPCDPPCLYPSCSSTCISCPGGNNCCKEPCSPVKCTVDCCNSFGMKIAVKRKPKFEPAPIELTPRSSCVQQMPLAARSCHHFPTCLPPSSCFPYLMPCYWPARAGAPCNTPSHCFHNPPCRAPRRPKPKLDPAEMCPPGRKCLDNEQKKCENVNCLGCGNCGLVFYKLLEKKDSPACSQNKNKVQCQCAKPRCANCFVIKPKTSKTA